MCTRLPVAAAQSISGADMSALEEIFAMQLRAMRLPEPVREYQFAPPRRFRFDFAYPDKMLAIEIDGGTYSKKSRHTTGTGVNGDCHKFCVAVVHGWRVLRGDSKMVKSGELLQYLELALK